MGLDDTLNKYKLSQERVNLKPITLKEAEMIAPEIIKINDMLTDREYNFFIAGFQECVKYFKAQREQSNISKL